MINIKKLAEVQPQLSGNEFSVLFYITNCCSYAQAIDKDYYEASFKQIKEHTNIKKNDTIISVLTRLVELGLITKQTEWSDEKNRKTKCKFTSTLVIPSPINGLENEGKSSPKNGQINKININNKSKINMTYNISTYKGSGEKETTSSESNENGTGFGSFLYGKETSAYFESTEPERETETLQVEESENTPNGKEQLLPTDEETTLQREEPNNTPTSTPTKEIKNPGGVILPTGTTTITSTAIHYQDSLNEEKTKVREIKRDIDSGVFDNLHQLEQRLIFTPIVGGAYGEQLKRYFNYKCGSF